MKKYNNDNDVIDITDIIKYHDIDREIFYSIYTTMLMLILGFVAFYSSIVYINEQPISIFSHTMYYLIKYLIPLIISILFAMASYNLIQELVARSRIKLKPEIDSTCSAFARR